MDPDRVKEQLERVLSSPQFSKAERLARFLRVIVVESLDGNAGALKEHRIGVDVYERGAAFDPRIDPIVRVQAAKLRSKLLEYYAGPGASDPIVIDVPKGSYVPDIRERGSGRATMPTSASLDRSRVAVLPFVNIGDDPEHEHFADGLTEELINRLVCVRTLQVVARTSVFRFKGTSDDVREIGKMLDAGVVLEGSVRQAKDQVRVTAQLIAVESGYHLFSRTFQREFKDIFQLQGELAQAVVDEIAPGTPDRPPASAVVHPDAYHAYLRGMFALSSSYRDLANCVALFREALRIDPRCAPAWAGLAHAYWVMAWFRVMPADAALPLAREAALRTLEFDPDSAQALSALGVIESGLEWNWASAGQRFERAIALQPSLAIIYPFYAVICLLPQSRFGEACSRAASGLALDVFNPLHHAMATVVYAFAGRHDEALRQHVAGMGVDPGFPPTPTAAGLAHELAGRSEEAIACYRRALGLAGGAPAPMSFLAHALAVSGQTAEAKALLERLLAIPEPPELDIARAYSGLRDTHETLRWLDAAVEHRNIHLVTVPPDGRFSWLHGHPRFRALLDRMNLASRS